MAKFDTLAGKYHAHFWFYDEYQIFEQIPDNEDIDLKTPPVFTTEADAEAAEDLAFDAFIATLRALPNLERIANLAEKARNHD